MKKSDFLAAIPLAFLLCFSFSQCSIAADFHFIAEADDVTLNQNIENSGDSDEDFDNAQDFEEDQDSTNQTQNEGNQNE